jgi:hypothetical protein
VKKNPLDEGLDLGKEFKPLIEPSLAFDHLDLTTRIHLLASLPKSWKMAVEIGVWQGAYMVNMMANTNMFIMGIDPYQSELSYCDPETITDIFEKDSAGDNLVSFTRYAHAQKTIVDTARELQQPLNAQIFRAYGRDMLPYIGDGIVDFVYIDGDHSYEAVKEDIAGWWPKVKVGGILAGHDYDPRNAGTIQAVDEFTVHLTREKKFNPEFRITGTEPEWGDGDAPSWVFIKETIR